jgi:hypothetical protein
VKPAMKKPETRDMCSLCVVNYAFREMQIMSKGRGETDARAIFSIRMCRSCMIEYTKTMEASLNGNQDDY